MSEGGINRKRGPDTVDCPECGIGMYPGLGYCLNCGWEVDDDLVTDGGRITWNRPSPHPESCECSWCVGTDTDRATSTPAEFTLTVAPVVGLGALGYYALLSGNLAVGVVAALVLVAVALLQRDADSWVEKGGIL